MNRCVGPDGQGDTSPTLKSVWGYYGIDGHFI